MVKTSESAIKTVNYNKRKWLLRLTNTVMEAGRTTGSCVLVTRTLPGREKHTWSGSPRRVPGQSGDSVAGRRGKTDASPKGTRRTPLPQRRRSVRAYVAEHTAMA